MALNGVDLINREIGICLPFPVIAGKRWDFIPCVRLAGNSRHPAFLFREAGGRDALRVPRIVSMNMHMPAHTLYSSDRRHLHAAFPPGSRQDALAGKRFKGGADYRLANIVNED